MSGRTTPFQFHTRRPSAVVRQSGPGRSTLHLGLAGGGGGGGGVTTAAGGAAGSRGTGAGGWRGRRGWWGSSRRLPEFLEFWGLAAAVSDDERSRREHARLERRERRRRRGSWVRSPEFSIFVLGLAALLAFVVFVCDMIAGRALRPISVLIFVAAGTYCLALIKQQRDLAASEQALVIEIMDGSMTSSSRRVISKEDRRDLFDYFTFRPSSSKKGVETASATATQTDQNVEVSAMEQGTVAPTAAAAAVDGDGGVSGVGDGRGREDRAESPHSSSLPPSPLGLSTPSRGPGGAGSDTVVPRSEQQLATPPISPSALALAGALQGEGGRAAAAAAAVGGVAGAGEVLGRVEVVEGSGQDEGEGGVMMLAPSSGAAAGLSPFFSVASGLDEGGSAIGGDCCGGDGVDSDERGGGGSGSKPFVAGPEKRLREGEELDDKEVPERGITRGLSELWSSGESCIICFGEYTEGDVLCRLPCRHTYHAECIDAWLDGPGHAWCPLCKSSLLPPTDPRNSSSNNDTANAGGTNATTASADSNAERLGSPAPAAPAAAVVGDEAV